MVNISVKLFASLRKYRPDLDHGEAANLELPDGATLNDVLNELGIAPDETKQCFVNALVQDLDWVLQDGDEVGVFPPIAGG